MEKLVDAAVAGLRNLGLDAARIASGRSYTTVRVTTDLGPVDFYCSWYNPRRLYCNGRAFTKTQSTELASYFIGELPACLAALEKRRDARYVEQSIALIRAQLDKRGVTVSFDRAAGKVAVKGDLEDAHQLLTVVLLAKFCADKGISPDEMAMVRGCMQNGTMGVRVFADWLEESHSDRYKEVEELRKMADDLDK